MSTAEIVPYLTDATGREHLLARDATSIGRAVENDIVIPSKRVSREHARVEREGWRVVLVDLGSTNGTFLNGERLAQPTALRDMDRIEIGEALLVYHDPDITLRETPFPVLEVDIAGGTARVDRRVVPLSPKEWALLAYLHARQGEVCSKDEIGEAVWPEYEDKVYDYQVENLVRRLRAKLEPDASQPLLVQTVRGQGYKLVVTRNR